MLVSNSVGQALSSPANLTVTIPPLVAVRATDATASEPGSDTGTFTFSRTNSLTLPLTVYFTVGDAQDLLYTPLESKASIEAVFDVLHERYHTARVWWRGGQDEVWGNQFVLREQNRYYWRVWEWWRDLQYRVVKCNQLAVKAAHARGMELWMAYGLFDNGSGPDVGFTGFPYAAEDKIRVEHPEWAPVNKYGTWHQGGPIEFCYEGARRAMVEYLTRYVVEGGYDGIAFLTYAENYSQRYEEEFGYNQPIVDEFRKRYGVDIRTQPFDTVAWCKLRGEYLTQFFREFHESLSKNGKKIAMCVDGKYPYWPCRWGGEKGVRTAGKLWMDVETWVKEGIVDELNLFHPVNDEAIQKGFELCKGSSTQLSTWGGSDKIPAGVKQLLTVNFDLESGFDTWRVYYGGKIPPQPPEALKSQDVYARRRILCAIEKGTQTAPVSEVIPLTRDPDLFVKRGALRALGTLKDPAAIPAVEASLLDPENSVRWQAAVVLGQLKAANCVEKLFEAVARTNSTFQSGGDVRIDERGQGRSGASLRLQDFDEPGAPGPQKASTESFGSRYHLFPSVWARVRPCRQRLGLAGSRQYPAGWFRRRGQRGAATDDAAKEGQKAG